MMEPGQRFPPHTKGQMHILLATDLTYTAYRKPRHLDRVLLRLLKCLYLAHETVITSLAWKTC